MSAIATPPMDRLEKGNGTNFDHAKSPETEVLARVLSAVSMNSNLLDALMSFHSDFCDEEALIRSALVLDRMDQMLPCDVAMRLRETSQYTRPWTHETDRLPTPKSSFLSRIAFPALYLASAVMFALCVVGCVTTYHYLLANSHPLATLALTHMFL